MTDIVAVVSVITSGAVGIGGVLVTGYGAWAERRWQRREERAIEVRTVLDDAAFPIGTELRSLSAAVQFIQNASADPSAAAQGELLDKARAQIDDVSDAAKQSWTVQSRLGLRLGLDSAVVKTLAEAIEQIARLHQSVLGLVDDPWTESVSELWDSARAAEKRCYDAASSQLRG